MPVMKNESGHFRGLHIVVINPDDGKVFFAKCFDTYKTCKGFDRFILYGAPPGFIVIAACKDDCVTFLSQDAKKWFGIMGSSAIYELSYR